MNIPWRRVAAQVSTVCERVAAERASPLGGEVGYAMRFERKTSKRTAVVFATDGLVVREMLGDARLDSRAPGRKSKRGASPPLRPWIFR